jgi:hypothetical protein
VYNSAGEEVKKILITHTASNVENVTGQADTVIGSIGDQVDLYWNGQWIGVWDGTNEGERPVENGDYFVKVDSVDPYGVVKTVTLTVTVARKVEKLTILVYNAAGEVVRHLTDLTAEFVPSAGQVALSSEVIQPGSTLSGTNTTLTVSVAGGPSVVWDGRNDDGITVEDGTYFVEVKSEGESGSGTVVVKAVSVLGATKSDVAQARPNVLTRGNPVCTVAASPGETVRAVVYTAAGEKAMVVWGETGAGRVLWDSTGAASGLYLLVAEVYDTAGRTKGRNVLKIIVQK